MVDSPLLASNQNPSGAHKILTEFLGDNLDDLLLLKPALGAEYLLRWLHSKGFRVIRVGEDA